METSKQMYKQQGHISLFDNEETMDKLNAMGNPLEKLSKVVDFEIFRNNLETALHKISELSLLVLLKFKFMARDLQHHLWFFPFRVGQMLCFGAYHTRDANIRNNANLLLI